VLGSGVPGGKRLRYAAPILLLAFFALGMVQVTHASLTFDEGPHLAIGYATLRTGDFRLQPVHIHPPLANVLAAAPLLLQDDLPDPRAVSGWEINSLSAITDAVVWQCPYPKRIAVAGRVPILFLGTLLGALIYRWAQDLGGHNAALLALALYAFDPNCIAHAALITTDTAATLFIVATLYVMYHWSRANHTPYARWSKLTLAGVLLGLALLTKVSALMLIPVTGAIVLIKAWVLEKRAKQSLVRAALWLSSLLLLAGFTVWAGYRFEVATVPGFASHVPAATHLKIYLSLREHYELGHPAYALGRVSHHGWWWYFPLAFILKTPLPVLILGFINLGRICSVLSMRLSRRWLSRLPALLSLSLFPAAYAVSALFSTVDIGYRHLLPLLPFLQLTTGVGMGSAWTLPPLRLVRTARLRHLTLTILLGWMALGTMSTLPYPLTFFNEIAGGPSQGYRYLVDSNLDWGQNLWDLRRWMDQHGERHVFYAHYSPARPEAYGVPADFLPPDPRAVEFTPWHPAPGLYAIGATVLQGPYAPDLNTFAWFRYYEPVAVLGHALFLYRVPPSPTPSWAVLCAGTLEPALLKARTGNPMIRIIRPDCTQSQVYPEREGPGLYVTPPTLSEPDSGYLLLVERNAAGDPTLHVFSVDHGAPAPEHPIVPTVTMDGPLAFLGYTVVTEQPAPGHPLLVQTHWRITGVPTRPLSLMAHLTGPLEEAVAVGDSLGYSIDQWQPGDILIQTHRLDIPAELTEGTELNLRFGAYWLDTMERWHLASEPTRVAISPSLPITLKETQ